MEWANRLNSFTPIAMVTYVPRRIINSCLVNRIKEFVVGIFSDFNDWLNSFDSIVNTRAMWCGDCANIHRVHQTPKPYHLSLISQNNNNNNTITIELQESKNKSNDNTIESSRTDENS